MLFHLRRSLYPAAGVEGGNHGGVYECPWVRWPMWAKEAAGQAPSPTEARHASHECAEHSEPEPSASDSSAGLHRPVLPAAQTRVPPLVPLGASGSGGPSDPDRAVSGSLTSGGAGRCGRKKRLARPAPPRRPATLPLSVAMLEALSGYEVHVQVLGGGDPLGYMLWSGPPSPQQATDLGARALAQSAWSMYQAADAQACSSLPCALSPPAHIIEDHHPVF